MPYAPGHCRECGTRCKRSRCAPCASARAIAATEERARRIKAGQCLFGSCREPVSQTKQVPTGIGASETKRVRRAARYCRQHLDYYAARARGETTAA